MFYFINTSSFFSDNEDVYPAELALAKFSLKEGIMDEIQILINPGDLPMGSRNVAQDNSKKGHRLPLPPDCPGETDYMKILEKIVKFLHPFDKMPILFTEGNVLQNPRSLIETKHVVEKIFYEAQEDSMMSYVKIYAIDELFFMLQKMSVIAKNRLNEKADKIFPSIFYAADKFQADRYCHLTTGCEFHNNIEADPHCCLSKVRRYAYTIAQWCSDETRFPLVAGKHRPAEF